MDELSSIERSLERLAPRGFSATGEASLNTLIDELSGETTEQKGSRVIKWQWALGFAAALAMALLSWANFTHNDVPTGLARHAAEDSRVELIVESEGVVEADNQATLLADLEGGLHRAWNVRVINEERFRDLQTGYEVTVTRPRDELVLLPVTSF